MDIEISNIIELDSKHGKLNCFTSKKGQIECLVIFNTPEKNVIPFARVHSACVFSEAIHTLDCDCASQLNAALEYIAKHGGYIFYLYQEGRGIGLTAKINAIDIQNSKGLDTASAFKELGHKSDVRSYDIVTDTMKALNIDCVVLDTSNPNKEKAFVDAGIKVAKRLRLKIESTPKIELYLKEKRSSLGHYEND